MMFNEKIYQTIFDEISAFLPKEWERVVVYLEYGEDTYSFSFYVKDKKQYIKCFDLPGIDEDKLMASFKRIDKAVLNERKKVKGNLWSNLTLTVSEERDIHADFDYTDLSEGAYKYSRQWKKKYLV